MNINDKEQRRRLEERYLDAETDLCEERLLNEYFASHAADPDEREISRLILASGIPEISREECLSDEGVQEYDRIAETGSKLKRRRKIFIYSGATAACAAAVLLFFVLRPGKPETSPSDAITPIEIAESLTTLADLDSQNIASISAKPLGNGAVIVVNMKNGRKSTFLMTKESETGSVHLLSMNGK